MTAILISIAISVVTLAVCWCWTYSCCHFQEGELRKIALSLSGLLARERQWKYSSINSDARLKLISYLSVQKRQGCYKCLDCDFEKDCNNILDMTAKYGEAMSLCDLLERSDKKK